MPFVDPLTHDRAEGHLFLKSPSVTDSRVGGCHLAVSHGVQVGSAMMIIVVHHVAPKNLKFVEAAFCRSIRGIQSEMPFVQKCRPVTRMESHRRPQFHFRIRIAPAVFRMIKNQTGVHRLCCAIRWSRFAQAPDEPAGKAGRFPKCLQREA